MEPWGQEEGTEPAKAKKTSPLNGAARRRIQRAIEGQLQSIGVEESGWWLIDLLRKEDFLVAQGGSTQEAGFSPFLERWWQKESAEIQKNCKWMAEHGLPVAFLSELSLGERFAWFRGQDGLLLKDWICHLLFLYPIQTYALALCLVLPRQQSLSEGSLLECIHALGQAYQQWEKAEGHRQDSLKRLKKFITSEGSLARLTNDFRKPLANLMLNHENISRMFEAPHPTEQGQEIKPAKKEEAFRQALRRFGDQLQMLEGYTNDLYYLLTGDAPELWEADDFSLPELIEEIYGQLQKHYADYKKLQIQWQEKWEDSVHLPKRHVFRILYNLMENACKFSATVGIIYLSVEAKGKWIRINIEDNGKGFYLRDEDFELSRLNLGRAAGSAGIGLATAYELTRRLGGRLLRRRPQFGQGTHFLLVLPNYL